MELKALAIFVVTITCSFASAADKSPSTNITTVQYKNTATKLPAKTSSPTVTARQKSKGTRDANTTPIPSAFSTQPSSSASSSKKTTGSTHNNSVTVAPEIPCKMRNQSCTKCVEDSDCFYCNVDKTCRKNTGKIIPTGCKGNKWYWKQCKILGNILIIIISSVGGVFLLTLGCCIYCCCCRRSGKNRAAREESRQQQRRLDRQGRNAERKQTRKERHDAIRLKYGLLQNKEDDDDPQA